MRDEFDGGDENPDDRMALAILLLMLACSALAGVVVGFLIAGGRL